MKKSDTPFAATYLHPYLKLTSEYIGSRILGAAPESLIILVGPSHVGKSTCAKLVKHNMKERFATEMSEDPSFVPFGSADLIWERKIGLQFKDLYRELLLSLSEQLGSFRGLGSRTDGTADLRRRLHCVLGTRRTKCIFLDEGQQIAAGTSNRTAVENLRALKNLSVIIKIPIVLSATYEILDHISAAAEIEGRSTIVHFPPYTEAPPEAAHFTAAVTWAERKLQARYPGFEFGAERTALMRGACGGRIGTLMRWLVNAAQDCRSAQNPENLDQWLKVNAPSFSRVSRFAAEDLNGETQLGKLCSGGYDGIFSPRAFIR